MNHVDCNQLARLHKAIFERLLIPNIPPMASNKDTFVQRHWSVLNADAHNIALYLLSNTDFTEVVRCKDCKHWEKFDDKYRTDGCCKELVYRHGAEMWATEGNHFCSYGERKENE